MNILFVLYGDFDSNSAIPLVLYARELHLAGHICAIAVPSNLDTVSQHAKPDFLPILYGDVLAAPDSVFPDGRPADVIHACTPREVVRHFVTSYMAKRPTPLVIYLEDNESWISTRMMGLNENTLVNYSEKEISERLPGALAHPFRYDSFIGLADAVAVIQEKLKIEIPPWVHCETVMIGADIRLFSPRPPDLSLRTKYGVAENEKVIVYHGGMNRFTRPSIETLCTAVGLINQQGYPCRLLRSGRYALDFLGQMPHETASAISDLGVLPRQELPDLLALADVFVQPGQIDPFEDLRLPGKVPEFLAMGRPVVMPNVNIAHLFRDGLDAVLLRSGTAEEIAAKCIGLFSDPQRASMIGRAGCILAEKYFDARNQARRLEGVYKTACGNFNPAIASEIWRIKDEDVPIKSLVARKLRLLADVRSTQSGFDAGEMLREHARYIELMQQRVRGLETAMAERDRQIASRNQAVAERDGQIASLHQVVSERDTVVHRILVSTSWRITAPLRAAKSFFTYIGDLTNARKKTPVNFDVAWYLRQNPDVAMSSIDPYEHYVSCGKVEGRQAAPDAFLMRNIKRAQLIYLFVLVAIRRGGGITPTINKVWTVLKRGGWSDLRRRMIHHHTLYINSKKPGQAYASYIEAMEPKQAELERMKDIHASFSYRPKFSIVVPVYNVEEKWLRRFIKSVQSQVYPDWELCIADDCSTAPHIRPLLLNYAASDPRIKLVFREINGHISKATNSAIELATGDFMCLMDNDDEIAPNALYEFAHLLNQDAQIDMIYSDEDKIDIHNKRYDPFFKPDWSPESLEGSMYTAHFACYQMSIVREVGSFRTGYDGAQDYDFVLRFSERAKTIVHVPKILYHWRAILGSAAATTDAKDYALEAAVRALTDRANRMSGGGEVKPGHHPGSFDVRYAIQGSPLVSVVIPSAGRVAKVRGESIDLLVGVVRSIYEKNTYRNFEVIIVDNGDLRLETIEALSAYSCRFVHFKGEFNIATKMNMGAEQAHGEYLLFMNDDIEAIAQDWMECMLQLAQRPGVGVVGAKLYFENDKLQHVGVAFWNGLPYHIGREIPGTDPGYFHSSCANRNYLAVTGAVMMSRRSVFEEVGGFDERLAINYNDIDYCLKVFQSGRRVVFAAGAELYQYESMSRKRTVAEDEIKLFQDRWMDLVTKDPYYGPYFENHPPNFSLRYDWLSVTTVDPLKSIVLS